jgi:predicted lipoprotein
MTERVIDGYVVPRFAGLKSASDKLAGDLAAVCNGEPQRMKDVRADFDETVLAWAQVEFLRFGPLSETGLPERFSFWPDPRGVVARQVRALIAKRDPTALDAASLAEKSAAIQGLPALELLLTSEKQPITANDEEGRYRCGLAVSIARNLAGIAGGMVSGWDGEDGWRRKMLATGPDNPRYRAPAEPPADFARAMITGLQMLQDRQVVPLIEANASPGKKPRLPFLQSGLEARYAVAAVASLEALYDVMDLAADLPPEKSWMPQWIGTAFNRLTHDLPPAMEASAGKAGPDRERELRFLRFHVEGIRKLIGRELAPRAGLMIGFNELDGD